MKIDDKLVKLVDQFSGRLSVGPFGNEIISLLINCYKKGAIVEDTFLFMHELFKEYGLIGLLSIMQL